MSGPVPQLIAGGYENLITPQKNNIYSLPSDPNGLTAMQAVYNKFDQDNNTIAQWFNLPPITGENIILQQEPPKDIVPGPYWALNHPESNTMNVSSAPLRNKQSFAPAGAVAEQVENYEIRQNNGWDPRHVNGEALSLLGMQTLHPETDDLGAGERIWFQNHGADWSHGDTSQGNNITNNSAFDKDTEASGQGGLFLQWLLTQQDQTGHNITLPEIVQAGGNNLGQTYQKLTGNAPEVGIKQFSAALAQLHPDLQGYLAPIGKSPFQ